MWERNVRRCSPELRQRARALRKDPTEAEAILWDALRRRQLGPRFRRQHPVGTFVLDFYCPSARLAVEVDGGIHNRPDVAAHDIERTNGINAHRVVVLRVTNEEVLNDLPSVLARIEAALA